MAVEVEDIVGEKSFETWLYDQPKMVTPVLSMRIAHRVLPNVVSIFSVDAPELTEDIAQNLTIHSFRANFISWATRKYPAHNMKSARSTARSAADSAAFSASSAVDSAAFSARSAARSAAFSTSFAARSAAFSASSAADSAAFSTRSTARSAAFSTSSAARSAAFSTSSARIAADSAVWEVIRADASTTLKNGAVAVFTSSLWPENAGQSTNQILSDTAQEQISNFKQTKEYTALPWGLWIAWWESLQNDTSHSLFGEKADLEIALKDDEFWNRDVAVVMDELAEIVGWPWGEERTSASPFSFGWSSIGTVTLTGDAFSAIWVPQNRSPDDAANRLAAAKKAAENLIADLQSGTLQANQAYASGLSRYVDELPGDVTSSIYVADQELRTLRDDLEDDLRSELLDSRFARRLLRVIEAHYGLRPYYPDLLNFYDDVRHGNLTEPPPLQAIADVEQLIRENTPDVFDVSVSQSLQRLEPDRIERPPQSSDTTTETEGAAGDQPIALPKDPIADIDPARAEQNAKSATLEKIGGVLSKVEKGAKNAERVEKVAKTYQKFAKPILAFIKGLMENGGDIPPGV